MNILGKKVNKFLPASFEELTSDTVTNEMLPLVYLVDKDLKTNK